MAERNSPRVPDGRPRKRQPRREKHVSIREQFDASLSLATGLLDGVVEHFHAELPRALNDALAAKSTTITLKPLSAEARRGLEKLLFFARHVSFVLGELSAVESEIYAITGLLGPIHECLAEEPLPTLCAQLSLDLRRRSLGLPMSVETTKVLAATEDDLSIGFLAMEWVLTLPNIARGRGRPRLMDSAALLHGIWLHAQRRSRIFTGPVALRMFCIATDTKPTSTLRKYWKRQMAVYDPELIAPALDDPSMAPIRPPIPWGM